MNGHRGLAGQPKRRWQRDGHHIAHITHIIFRQPLPKAEFMLVDDRIDIKDGEQVFHLVLRHLLVDAPHHGGI